MKKHWSTTPSRITKCEWAYISERNCTTNWHSGGLYLSPSRLVSHFGRITQKLSQFTVCTATVNHFPIDQVKQFRKTTTSFNRVFRKLTYLTEICKHFHWWKRIFSICKTFTKTRFSTCKKFTRKKCYPSIIYLVIATNLSDMTKMSSLKINHPQVVIFFKTKWNHNWES